MEDINYIIKEPFDIPKSDLIEMIRDDDGVFSNGLFKFNHIKVNGELITNRKEVSKHIAS